MLLHVIWLLSWQLATQLADLILVHVRNLIWQTTFWRWDGTKTLKSELIQRVGEINLHFQLFMLLLFSSSSHLKAKCEAAFFTFALNTFLVINFISCSVRLISRSFKYPTNLCGVQLAWPGWLLPWLGQNPEKSWPKSCQEVPKELRARKAAVEHESYILSRRTFPPFKVIIASAEDDLILSKCSNNHTYTLGAHLHHQEKQVLGSRYFWNHYWPKERENIITFENCNRDCCAWYFGYPCSCCPCWLTYFKFKLICSDQ